MTCRCGGDPLTPALFWKEMGHNPYSLALRALENNSERAVQDTVRQGWLAAPLRLGDIYDRTTLTARPTGPTVLIMPARRGPWQAALRRGAH
jgi:hypothetical protein